MKKKLFALMMLLAMAVTLSAAALVPDGYTADRYCYDQLDADEQAIYDALLAARPPETLRPVTVRIPMPVSTTRYSSFDFVYTALYAFEQDNPLQAAWFDFFRIKTPNGRDVPFEQLMADTPDLLPEYSEILLEIDAIMTRSEADALTAFYRNIADRAPAEADRYRRAVWIRDQITALLRYDYQEVQDLGIDASARCLPTGYAVCEGFSKAYKALADMLEVPCVLSGGYGHMCVQIQMPDGRWYLTEPQGGLMLAGLDRVRGNEMYYPQEGPWHFRSVEGHGAVLYAPIPETSYRR